MGIKLSLHVMFQHFSLFFFFVSSKTVWDEYMDTTRQKDKQTNEMPQLSRDPKFPQTLLRQTCESLLR